MTVIEVRRNDLRSALVELNYGVMFLLDDSSKQTHVKEFGSDVDQLCLDVKQKYRHSPFKDVIRKALNEQVRQLRSLAKEIAEGGRFQNGKMLYDIYDGMPLTDVKATARSYDIVVRLDPNRIKVIVFAPSKQDDFDPLRTQVEAETDFGLHCVKVEERSKFPEVYEQERGAQLPPPELERSNVVDSTLNIEATKELEIIGRVLFSRKDQFNLRTEQTKDEIKGFLFEKYMHTVRPLDILVIENEQQQKKIYAYVSDIDVNPNSGGGYVSRFSEIATHVVFQPLVEKSSDYQGRVRPMDLTDFAIRQPTDEELREVLNVPKNGLPLGELDYGNRNDTFMYPTIPDDTIYQSMIVAGVQGKGKSNLLKLAIRTLASDTKVNPAKRPAIIILDGEGEYKSFTKKAQMSSKTRHFLDRHGIGDIEPNVYTVNDDPAKASHSLSLRGIGREDIVYLMPELESRTENILMVLINHVTKQLEYENAGQDIETLRNRLISECNSSGLIHAQQRPAISRAVLSPSLNLLDQKGKIPLTPALLFKPGTISVIDYQGLDYNKKRVVALYILQMLSRFKMDAPNYDPGVLLVVDEAELLFPANPSNADKDYVTRIASRLEDITNRGRKRKYGLVFVTHSPSKVSQQVGDLANTKVAFNCTGANKWIRDNFGKEYVSEINDAPTGICRIKIKVGTKDQGSINARIRVPYVGPSDSNSDANGD